MTLLKEFLSPRIVGRGRRHDVCHRTCGGESPYVRRSDIDGNSRVPPGGGGGLVFSVSPFLFKRFLSEFSNSIFTPRSP